MSRFKDIVIHPGTVDIGAGLTWTEVYSYLVPRGINVVGGRLDGVGVGGLTLGGGLLAFQLFTLLHRVDSSHVHVIGYSWKTNQYGLTVDTLAAFELVLPTGEVKVVTEENEDLWFALKVRASNCCKGRLVVSP